MQLEHINVNIFGLSALFWGLFPWVMLSRLACRNLGRLSNGFIFSYIPDFGDLIRGVDIFIKTSLGCWGWRSFSCTSCSGRGGDSAVFRLASCAHIHFHCLVLLPLMSRFGKGKPEFEERWYGKADRIRKMRSLSVLSLLVVFFPWANSENRRLLKDFPLASVCRWSYADNFASLF